jgi:MIP family channel proteins
VVASGWRPEVAEAIGAFGIVVVAGGAGGAFSAAFIVAVLVYALTHVCGAHFNPAITLAFTATGHFPPRRAARYIAAQLAGALAGAACLAALLGDGARVAVTTLAPGVAAWRRVLAEAVANSFLALVIISVATDRRAVKGAGGLAIGLAVGAGVLLAGPLTGGSMNPARTLGPALLLGGLGGAWVHVAGSVLGAVVAMFTYEWLRPAEVAHVRGEPLGALGPLTEHEHEHPVRPEDAS